MKNRNLEYLQNIIDYCDKINNLLIGVDYDTFITHEIYQLSCGMCIIQIGENISRLSDDFKLKHDNIPWRSIKDMRNIMTHRYEIAEFEVMWYALTVEVNELKEDLLMLIKE